MNLGWFSIWRLIGSSFFSGSAPFVADFWGYYSLIPKGVSGSAHLIAGFSTGTEVWRASPLANSNPRTSAK
jgi:hypothetical protein